jgi:hypothetical protein|tara:strand:+ start:912 stop:1184 length:273 start_codon:yes stop_codon:yes gene_type:complete
VRVTVEQINMLKSGGQPGKYALRRIAEDNVSSLARMVHRTHVNLSNTDLQIRELKIRKEELKLVFKVVDELCPDWRDFIETDAQTRPKNQ